MLACSRQPNHEAAYLDVLDVRWVVWNLSIMQTSNHDMLRG